jgi:GxxExxY protein
VPLPLTYKELKIEGGYRMDLLVEERVVVEIKACDAICPVHEAQLLTYLKLSGRDTGLILNFHVALMRQGIRRMVLERQE